jgi:hypothetical protein
LPHREFGRENVPNLGLTTASVANKIIEGRKFMLRRILLITASVAAVTAVQCAPARAQNCSVGSLPCVYSVKFICGDQPANPNLHLPSEPPVKPGNYATAVNIHNFHQSQKAIILKRAVIANPENQPPGQISPFRQVALGPGQAFEIDCADIVTLFGSLPAPLPPFIKGFVELRGQPPNPFPTLSVTAVYTAQAATAASTQGGPVSVEVVPVQPFGGP